MTIPANRPYSGAADLHSMLDLLVAVRPAERMVDYPSAVDLRELIALTAVQDNTRLWFDADDRLVGFAPGGRLSRAVHDAVVLQAGGVRLIV